jgi:hypothetical protein
MRTFGGLPSDMAEPDAAAQAGATEASEKAESAE